MASLKRYLGPVIFGVLPGLLGLGVGGYFVARNVLGWGIGGVTHGPNACTVLSRGIAEGVLGTSAQLTQRAQLNPQETFCMYSGDKALFVSLTVGSWDYIKAAAPSSGTSNQGIGPGTYLMNTAVSTDSTIAAGSATGRVARRGDVGIEVRAGHYGQFFGADAVQELALEDRLEKQLVAELLPRV